MTCSADQCSGSKSSGPLCFVGSTEAPSKIFLLFFLFSKVESSQKSNERGFLTFFRAMFVTL